MLLFTGFMMMSLGTGWGVTMLQLFATYVVEAEGQTQQILLGYYGANILALPLWVMLSERIGKKPTWMIGGTLFVIITPSFLLLGPETSGASSFVLRSTVSPVVTLALYPCP